MTDSDEFQQDHNNASSEENLDFNPDPIPLVYQPFSPEPSVALFTNLQIIASDKDYLNDSNMNDSLQNDLMIPNEVINLNDSLQNDSLQNDLRAALIFNLDGTEIDDSTSVEQRNTVSNLQADHQNDSDNSIVNDSLQNDLRAALIFNLDGTEIDDSTLVEQRNMVNNSYGDLRYAINVATDVLDDASARGIAMKVFELLRDMETPKIRRPLLSMLANLLQKNELEEYIGKNISHREFADARKHAKIHGMLRCVPKDSVSHRRNRLREHVLVHFIEWCHRNNIFQSVAYGHKVLSYSQGVHIAVESIKSRLCCSTIQFQYVKEWETYDDENSPEEHIRCHHCCPKSNARCMKHKGHIDRHRYTPVDRLSISSVRKVIDQITSGHMKSLRGLDDTDTEKGTENFEQMRHILSTLIEEGRFGSEGCQEGVILMKDIDEVEEFHKVGYPQHLGAEDSFHICTCFECGFHCSDDSVTCQKRDQHSGPCDDCVFSFSVFERLFQFWIQIDKFLTDTMMYGNRPSLKNDMTHWYDTLENCLRNFLDYRRHIAQAEDEAIYDSNFLNDKLNDDEAVVYIDYKMKILNEFFREKSKDWFGKKGTSCLGAMLLLPKHEHGSFRKVVYHLFFSQEGKQDSAAVNTIKFLYKEIAPLHGINKIHCKADGAGQFTSLEIKVAMPLWKYRTGVEELSYKHNVPGKGKTGLDGHFGVLSQKIKKLVDEGNSFKSCDELVQMLSQKAELRNTYIHQMEFKREKMTVWGADAKRVKNMIGFKAQLEAQKFYLLKNEDGKVTGFHHSRHSKGKRLTVLDRIPDHGYEIENPLTFVKYTQKDRIQQDHGSQYIPESYSEREEKKRKSKIDRKNEELKLKHQKNIEFLQSISLHACSNMDHQTGIYCNAGPFYSKHAFQNHKCTFPSLSSSDVVLQSVTSGRLALCLACGSIPNRDRASSSFIIKSTGKQLPKDIPFRNLLVCEGGMRRDMKEWKKERFVGTQELIRDLETMFLAGKNTEGRKAASNKISPPEAVARLANMKDPDGMRKYRKDNKETGPLPSVEYVKNKFSQMKRDGLKGVVRMYEQMERDCNFSNMSNYRKRELFEAYFSCEYSDLQLAWKLIEYEENIQGIERDEDDRCNLDMEECLEILEQRGIPFGTKKEISTALSIVLRFQERFSSHTFARSMTLSEHAEAQRESENSLQVLLQPENDNQIM